MSYLKYEEGVWTPSLEFGGGSTGITYSSRSGFYRIIGDIVFYRGIFTLTNKGSSTGNATISGLPVANSSLTASPTRSAVLVSTGFTFTANYGVLTTRCQPSSTIMLVRQLTSTSLSEAAATDTNFSNTTELLFNGFYFA
jgi:hypothetical protein